VKKWEPSLPDDFEDSSKFVHYGSGHQFVTTGGNQGNNMSTGYQSVGAPLHVTNHTGTLSKQ